MGHLAAGYDRNARKRLRYQSNNAIVMRAFAFVNNIPTLADVLRQAAAPHKREFAH